MQPAGPPSDVIWQGVKDAALWVLALVTTSVMGAAGYLHKRNKADRKELHRNSAVLLRHARRIRTYEKRLKVVRIIGKALTKSTNRIEQLELFTQQLSTHMGEFQQTQLATERKQDELRELVADLKKDTEWIRDILSGGGKIPGRHDGR